MESSDALITEDGIGFVVENGCMDEWIPQTMVCSRTELFYCAPENLESMQ